MSSTFNAADASQHAANARTVGPRASNALGHIPYVMYSVVSTSPAYTTTYYLDSISGKPVNLPQREHVGFFNGAVLVDADEHLFFNWVAAQYGVAKTSLISTVDWSIPSTTFYTASADLCFRPGTNHIIAGGFHRFYNPTRDQLLICLDRDDGSVIWNGPTGYGSSVPSTMTTDTDAVYLPAYASSPGYHNAAGFNTFSTTDGSHIATTIIPTTRVWNIGCLLAANDALYVSGGPYYSATYSWGAPDATFLAVDKTSGSIIWSDKAANFGGEYYTFPRIRADLDGHVYYCGGGTTSNYGMVRKLTSSGSLLWQYVTNKTVVDMVIDREGNAYLSCGSGANDARELIKLDSSGSEAWTFTPEQAIVSHAVAIPPRLSGVTP